MIDFLFLYSSSSRIYGPYYTSDLQVKIPNYINKCSDCYITLYF